MCNKLRSFTGFLPAKLSNKELSQLFIADTEFTEYNETRRGLQGKQKGKAIFHNLKI